MYRINPLNRPVLITFDEVMFHMPSDADVSPRQIIQNIIIAEERWVAQSLGNALYDEIVSKKNKLVTQDNQAGILTEVNNSLAIAGKPSVELQDIPVGTYINAIEYVNKPHKELWDMYLWKICAEAVDLTTTVHSWLRHTAQGQQKNNPEVIGGNGQNSASGDRRDVQYKMDKTIQDRITPLIERMHLWICERKSNYPLYTRPCSCDENGISFKRKTDWVFT